MKRSKFSLSHYKLLSCDMGELIPAACFEVLPGDTVQANTSLLVRMAPMLAPPMHPVHARVHWWYVPYRIIWDDFEDFITGGPDGMDASVYPTVTAGGSLQAGTLLDYLGLPPGLPAGMTFSALPQRAYSLIWNEWYRDQDLQTELVISTASGNDTTTNATLQNVNWEKDYFTSSRPWEQKGPSVTIPLTGDAPVKGIGFTTNNAGGAVANVKESDLGTRSYTEGGSNATNTMQFEYQGGATKFPNIFADLSAVSGVSINDLREALAIQRFEEARARYGSRFVEYLRYLGVRSSDARLQRPEYLGGGKQTLQFSEVLQTSPDATTGFVGTMRGHGIGAMRSRRFRRFFEEHGIVMALLSVKPRTMYMQGVPRMWSRRVKEDFWQKELQHIGQQEVLFKEVYAPHATPDGTFGFQDRYDEYRREESRVAGEFTQTTLDYWHFARKFASDPALNDTFVKSVPTERVFASAATDVLYVMASHSIQARRLVSKVGTSFTF